MEQLKLIGCKMEVIKDPIFRKTLNAGFIKIFEYLETFFLEYRIIKIIAGF